MSGILAAASAALGRKVQAEDVNEAHSIQTRGEAMSDVCEYEIDTTDDVRIRVMGEGDCAAEVLQMARDLVDWHPRKGEDREPHYDSMTTVEELIISERGALITIGTALGLDGTKRTLIPLLGDILDEIQHRADRQVKADNFAERVRTLIGMPLAPRSLAEIFDAVSDAVKASAILAKAVRIKLGLPEEEKLVGILEQISAFDGIRAILDVDSLGEIRERVIWLQTEQARLKGEKQDYEHTVQRVCHVLGLGFPDQSTTENVLDALEALKGAQFQIPAEDAEEEA